MNKKTNILIILMLIALAYVALSDRINSPGFDFIQYWGVIKMCQMHPKELASPYSHSEQYAKYLKLAADKSSSKFQKEATYLRPELDLTSPPLLYSFFIILPNDYDTALVIYRIVQTLVFIGSIIILGLIFKQQLLILVTFALIMFNLYEPMSQDLWTGNFNAIQLGMLSYLAFLAMKIENETDIRKQRITSLILVCGLIFFNMLKPNYVLVTLALMCFLWKTLKTKSFFATLAGGGIFGLILLDIPCILFNSFSIWIDWWHALQRLREQSLHFLYGVEKGNFSTPLVLAKLINTKTEYCTWITACFLVLTLFLAIVVPSMCTKSDEGSLIKRVFARISYIFENPMLCISIGIIITMGLSPLIWMHYFVILILPCMWLILDKSPWKYGGIAATITLFLASGVVFRILKIHWSQWYTLVPYMFGFTWVPIWIAMLGIVIFGYKQSRCGSNTPSGT